MADQQQTQFYIVDGAMLPEVFRKVTEAKSLLERGEASTVAEAVAKVGISRSAFYKYKGAVSPFRNMKVGRIITYHIVLRDKMGSLSELLAIFTNSGANSDHQPEHSHQRHRCGGDLCGDPGYEPDQRSPDECRAADPRCHQN